MENCLHLYNIVQIAQATFTHSLKCVTCIRINCLWEFHQQKILILVFVHTVLPCLFISVKDRKGATHESFPSNSWKKVVSHVCNHKVSGKICGLPFKSRYQLEKHQRLASHQACKHLSASSIAQASKYMQTIDKIRSQQQTTRKVQQSLDIHIATSHQPQREHEGDKQEEQLSGDEQEQEQLLTGDELEDDIPCVICMEYDLSVEDESEVIYWIQYTTCESWVHSLCLPPDYEYDENDDDFT